MIKSIILFLSACSLLNYGFAQAPTPPPASTTTNAVMRVNGLDLTRDMLNREREVLTQQMSDASETVVMKAAISNLVQRLALNHAVSESKITVTNAEVNQQIRETKAMLPDHLSLNAFLSQRNTTKDMFIQQLAAAIQVNKFFLDRVKTHEPTAAEISKYFQENKASFVIPEAVDVQHFMISTRATDTGEEIAKKRQQITRYREQVARGESFDDLATLFSEGPRASDGGRLGLLGKESFAKELQASVFNLKKKDQITEVLSSEQGFHFFKLLNRREAEPLKLDQSEDRIREFLKQRHQQRERKRVMKALADKANVERL